MLQGFSPTDSFGERTRVLKLDSGVTATIVAPSRLDKGKRIDLILYGLPNGNSTAETMGKPLMDSVSWRYDIQNIAAQTRAVRRMGMPQAVVVYLEAEKKSWPEWRRARGYDAANQRIVRMVKDIRSVIGSDSNTVVTLTGHSGGGSFMFGFIEGQEHIPLWVDRIAFLDANYNFESKHGPKITEWLAANPRNRLEVIAYDDRNIMLDGKKVVSDSGGTFRASERMASYLAGSMILTRDTLGEFMRTAGPQVEILVHPNLQNKILHTEMIGEMNAYMHVLFAGRSAYSGELLRRSRAY